MKKLFLISGIVLMFTSCAAPKLYYWGSMPGRETSRYEEFAYQNYDDQTPESICDLICVYEDMVKNPGGTRKVVPPGICAEYGFLLLQPNTAEAFEKSANNRQRKIFSTTDYVTFFPQYGITMIQKEIELYPESATFINPLLKRLKEQ